MMRYHRCLSAIITLLGTISLVSAVEFSSYAPIYANCPHNQQWLRPAKGLSTQEEAWVRERKSVVANGLESYLQELNISGLDVHKLISEMKKGSNIPTISMAISGGGWGSGLTATGALRAFDARFPDAVKQKTGGLLQSLTYLSGLSGGAWPVMSLATNDFPSINDMVASWHTEIDRFNNPPNNSRYAGNFSTLFYDVADKLEAGFNVSVTDFLGRDFGYEFLPQPRAGLNATLSGIANLPHFKNHSMPMPMFQANRLTYDDVEFFGVKVPYYNSSIFEMTPFDFILGVAAAAFNFWYVEAKSNGSVGSFSKRSLALTDAAMLSRRAAQFPAENALAIWNGFEEIFNLTLDEAMYPSVPNPFAGTNPAESEALQLTDGSETGQSIAYWGLIQPARKSDFIITWDNDQDQAPYSWNNGTNIYNTYIQARRHGLPFPEIPPPATFIKRNYTNQPVFFGCDTKYTTTHSLSSPIVLYLANSPYSAYTNFTWFQSKYTPVQMHGILVNGFDVVTQGNGTLDSQWSQCLGCAAIDRSLSKMSMKRPQQCEKCLEKYCWDGTYEDGADIPVVDLPLKLAPNVSYAEWNASHPWV
ncbi:hypothetical protein H2200_008076 [Cladophialophora chaetospira]|uniref:Lysophospholipase n=1 Tax=Cladophialophora chaetospira TaxID=386627 RepID=A0AA38X6Z1_9EURO|nr:hypothetical protein H2200_008076 [Cladophialophora chaetospira]